MKGPILPYQQKLATLSHCPERTGMPGIPGAYLLGNLLAQAALLGTVMGVLGCMVPVSLENPLGIS